MYLKPSLVARVTTYLDRNWSMYVAVIGQLTYHVYQLIGASPTLAREPQVIINYMAIYDQIQILPVIVHYTATSRLNMKNKPYKFFSVTQGHSNMQSSVSHCQCHRCN